MPLFGNKGNKGIDYKARLEHKLYLARENPEPFFDLSDCALKAVPPGIYSLCKVFRKDILYLQENHLTSLTGGGSMQDLSLLQVLDLHSNSLTRLPDEIQYLKRLRVLNINSNQLTHLPEVIGELERLQTLNVSENSLKNLPNSMGNLHHLQHLDVRFNKKLTHLPASLCRAQYLKILLLNSEGFIYPPEDVVQQGTEAIMKFLAAECGIDYVSLQGSPNDSSVAGCSSPKNKAEPKEQEIRIEEQKQKERLALEKTIEEHQRKELDLQNAMKRSKGRLLEDLVQQQTKLESEILRIQHDKEAERQLLVQELQQVEVAADSVVSQLLALNSNERNSAHLQQLLEHERQEEEQMLNIRQEEYQSLRRRDVLNAMETLLEEEGQREKKLREYEEGRWKSTRTLLSQEVESDKQLGELLMSHGQANTALVSRLQRDEELQRAAVAALLERSDARSWGLVQHVALVETQLAALTAVEMRRRKLELTEQVEELCMKRVALSELLMDLLEQQAARRRQLLNTLEEMERRRWLGQDVQEQQDGRDYWLLQYQRLLDSRFGSLMELERSLDPALGHQLILAGVIHCLPFLAEWLTPPSKLVELTDDKLAEAGVSSAETRQAILRAVGFYWEDLERRGLRLPEEIRSKSPSLTEPEASAPSESDVEMARSIGIAECVVCMDQQCEVIFVPCGHMCCCIKCSELLLECPLCRGTVDQKIRVLLP